MFSEWDFADADALAPAAVRVAQCTRPLRERKHSAFFATPLDLLLRHLRVRRLLVSGVAGDQCVLLTAIEARTQDYDVTVPADCVGSPPRGETLRRFAI